LTFAGKRNIKLGKGGGGASLQAQAHAFLSVSVKRSYVLSHEKMYEGKGKGGGAKAVDGLSF